jgi:BON domain
MIDEHQLRQNVLDELEYEPSINADHIGVGVHAGVVTLTGFVSSYGEKLAAERAARRVKGVKAIAEEIEIRLPSDKKVADDEIGRTGSRHPQMARRLSRQSDQRQGREGDCNPNRRCRLEFPEERSRSRRPQPHRRRWRRQLDPGQLAGSGSRGQRKDPEGAAS